MTTLPNTSGYGRDDDARVIITSGGGGGGGGGSTSPTDIAAGINQSTDIEEIKQRITDVDSNTDGLETLLTTTNSSLTTITSEIQSIDTTLGLVEDNGVIRVTLFDGTNNVQAATEATLFDLNIPLGDIANFTQFTQQRIGAENVVAVNSNQDGVVNARIRGLQVNAESINTSLGTSSDAAVTAANVGSISQRLRGLQQDVADLETLVTTSNVLLGQISTAVNLPLTIAPNFDASFVAATLTGNTTPTLPTGFFPQTVIVQCDKDVNLRIANNGLNFPNLNIERGVVLTAGRPMIIKFVSPLLNPAFFWSNSGTTTPPFTFTITLVQSTEV
jgi:hypothetical protein